MRRTLLFVLLLLTLATGPLAADTVFSARAQWSPAPPAPGSEATLEVTIHIADGWHINSQAPLDPFLIPTRIRLELPTGWQASPARFPAHYLARFAFSDDPVAVYDGEVTVAIPIRRLSELPLSALRGAVAAQACDDNTCLPPVEVPFAAPVDPAALPDSAEPVTDTWIAAAGELAPLSEYQGTPSGLSSRFTEGGLALQLLLVFLAGLALNLTPCVYPLIPITVGFFMSQRASGRGRAWLLAVAYVLGMSVTYSALGVAAALTGRLFGAALQSPWVVGVIAAVLLALAASMFGFWELRVPAFASRLSGGRSGVAGALVMGLVVGLVAAPCIGPFVLGLLTFVGQRGDVIYGLAVFFTLSLGLGLPYLFLGVFTRSLDRLPNSGAWMLGVRQLFGVLLVSLAGFFVQPLLPSPWSDLLLPWLLLIGGVYLLVIARPAHEHPWVDRGMRLASAALLIAGTLLLPARGGSGGTVRVSWEPYEEQAVAAALAAGGPVVLDFFADWCAPCKELDRKTFSDPVVADRLDRFARFKVDLTQTNPDNDVIRRRYGVLGVPTVAFFRDGREVGAARLTGFEPPDRFLARLETVTP